LDGKGGQDRVKILFKSTSGAGEAWMKVSLCLLYRLTTLWDDFENYRKKRLDGVITFSTTVTLIEERLLLHL
jgi:hypothetical protein